MATFTIKQNPRDTVELSQDYFKELTQPFVSDCIDDIRHDTFKDYFESYNFSACVVSPRVHTAKVVNLLLLVLESSSAQLLDEAIGCKLQKMIRPMTFTELATADALHYEQGHLQMTFSNLALCKVLPLLSRVRGVAFLGASVENDCNTVSILELSLAADKYSTVLEDVSNERVRADRVHGSMPRHKSKEYWLTALIEEVGEVARAIQDEGNTEYMAELIQVAGVAVAAVVDLQCSLYLQANET
jgi:hypothetical protein